MKKFNLLVGHLFGRLYDNFPVPLRVRPALFLDVTTEENNFDSSFDFVEYFRSTVKWLETAEYIWITQDLSDDACVEFDVVLSEKGLEALRKVPETLEGTESIGERLSRFVYSKTSEGIGTMVSLAITSAISGVSISS